MPVLFCYLDPPVFVFSNEYIEKKVDLDAAAYADGFVWVDNPSKSFRGRRCI